MAGFKARLGALMGVTALTVGLGVTGANPAAAEPGFAFDAMPLDRPGGGVIIDIYEGADRVGYGAWWADPADGTPGDALVASDLRGDGYGIETHLSTSPERIASTRGHEYPYRDIATGDLREGSHYTMYVCVVKGSFHKCSQEVSVHA
ncbi:hypothetical protein ACWCP6_32270 [Streptomyces sp. NPDC002004]